MPRLSAPTFKNLCLIVLLFATMTQNSRAASEEQEWSEWFLEEFETARLPKKADFNARQIWRADSVKVLDGSNEALKPLPRYFVIDPTAGDVGTSRLVFGTFHLLGTTYNPHTDVVKRQNRMVPVIFGDVYRDTAESDPVFFSTKDQAAVMTTMGGGKLVTLVRVKGSGNNLKIFAIDRRYSSDGELLHSTYSYMDTLLYRRGPDGKQWMHPAHELEFTVPPQPN